LSKILFLNIRNQRRHNLSPFILKPFRISVVIVLKELKVLI